MKANLKRLGVPGCSTPTGHFNQRYLQNRGHTEECFQNVGLPMIKKFSLIRGKMWEA